MAITWLAASTTSRFPPVQLATQQGLLAAGGDLSISRLLDAYQHGIFPWFNQHDPILWWCPDPRTVLYTDKIKISKSLKKTLRKTDLTLTFDQAFTEVIDACATPRQQQDSNPDNGTWIHPDMKTAYIKLHQLGYAHSVECWHGDNLVGGLYGVAIGKVFFGESMFSLVSDSSKIALVALCHQLQRWGFPFIDCQIYSDHLASLGAEPIGRDKFIQQLHSLCNLSPQTQPWKLDTDLPQL